MRDSVEESCPQPPRVLRFAITLTLALMIIMGTLVAVINVEAQILGDIYSSTTMLEGAITSISVSEDGEYVAVGTSAGGYGMVALISKDGSVLWSWMLRGEVVDLEATDDLSKIAVATSAKEVYLYDNLGTVEFRWERGGRGDFVDLALDSSASTITVVDSGSPPYIYMLSVQNPLGRWEEVLDSSPTSVSYLLTEEGYTTSYTLASVGEKLIVWTTEDFNPAEDYWSPTFREVSVTEETVELGVLFETPDGRMAVAAAYSSNFTVLSWSTWESLLHYSIGEEYMTGGPIVDVKVSRGGEYVYVASTDYNVYCFEWENGRYVFRWSISVGREVTDIDVSYDGSLILAGTVDGWIYLVTSNGDILWKCRVPGAKQITAVGISGDGTTIVAGCDNGRVYIIGNDNVKRYNLYLKIEGSPVQANVTVQRLETGETLFSETITTAEMPVLLLTPGEYVVTFDSLQYGRYVARITLKSDNMLRVPEPRLWSVPIYPLTVKVVDAETGEPVGGVVLEFIHRMLDPSKYAGENLTVTVPPSGEITVPLKRDVYTVKTVFDEDALGYSLTVVDEVPVLNPEPEPLIIRLSPKRATLTFRVVDDKGRPLQGAKVEVSGVGVGITDHQGITVFDSVRYGMYTVLVTHQHFRVESPITVNVRGDVKVDIRMKPKLYRLQLNVVDEETGDEIQKVTVSIIGERVEKQVNMTITPTNNAVELPYGPYTITLHAPNYIDRTLNINLDSDKTLDVKLTPMKYQLVVTVLGKHEEPIVNATVTAIGGTWGPETARTDEYGRATLELRPGSYMVRVEAAHYQKFQKPLDMAGPTTYTIMLTPKNYTVVITALDAQYNITIPKYTVEVVEAGEKILTRQLTPENNTLELPYGNYTLKVVAQHYMAATEKLLLDRDTTLTLPLVKTLYPLTIIVKDDTGAPLTNVPVLIESPPLNIKIPMTTDDEGKAITTLPFGAYQVTVEAPGYNPLTQVVTVDKPLTIELSVQPTVTTLILRYIPYTLLAAAAAALLAVIWIRRKKRLIPEEEFEEI